MAVLAKIAILAKNGNFGSCGYFGDIIRSCGTLSAPVDILETLCQRDVSLLVLESTEVSDPMLDPTVEIPEILKFSNSRNVQNFVQHFVSKRCVFLGGSGRYPYFPKCANKHVFEELESKATRWRKNCFQ